MLPSQPSPRLADTPRECIEALPPKAFHGEGLFFVSTGPEIPLYDRGTAKVANDTGVGRLVNLSSMDVEQGIALDRWHEQGEAAIRAAGTPFVFVRLSGFMSNLLAWATPIKREGVMCSSTANESRGFVDPVDIAGVSVAALSTAR